MRYLANKQRGRVICQKNQIEAVAADYVKAMKSYVESSAKRTRLRRENGKVNGVKRIVESSAKRTRLRRLRQSTQNTPFDMSSHLPKEPD